MRRKFLYALILFFLAVFLFYSWMDDHSRGLDIYFVRHAETVANATGDYNAENQKEFTKKGYRQIQNLTRILDKMSFDHVLVSPKYRTKNTILPYLKKNNLVGQIWPEVAECCWQGDEHMPASVGIPFGKIINIKKENFRFFKLRSSSADRFYNPQTYSDGIEQIKRACELIERKYSGTGKSLLIVSHWLATSRMLEMFLGIEIKGRFNIKNAKLIHLRKEAGGKYRLMTTVDAF
ncbi:MAG: histidine phosphatase family protein [Candidatus Aceula meridiana]|nr:histidine phosphatase family protein [Candidatus Aceula meridiana]